jgi:DNA polymerase-3 subunit delta'
MQFKDIIGQSEVKERLCSLVEHNRLSHALLFSGKEGGGALSLALAFAQFIICENTNGVKEVKREAGLFGEEKPLERIQVFDSCGKCPGCIRAGQYIHPDIHFSYPVVPRRPGDKPLSTDYISEWREFIRLNPYGNAYDWLQFIGAENKQGNITAYECNDILRKLTLKSFESGFKILIMWMPEYLGNEGNKLLKLIEEPPPNTLFILVGENESLILPTILSRCQMIRIPALDVDDIETALVTRCRMEEQQARQIASVSEGNYREALQLMQDAEGDWQDLLREWLNAVLKTGPVAQVKWIEEISKMGREKQKQFLRYFNHLLEQSIRVKLIGENSQLNIARKELDFINRLNKLADISQQQTLIEELDKAMYYIERNAHAKMLFHALTIKFYHIIKDRSLVVPW